MTAKQRIRRLAAWSIVVAFGVMGLKFVAWWMTGSVALYSDALESIVNVIAGFAAFWAISVSHKPADRDHQYGHHKAEYFSAVLEGVLIVVAALLIMGEVWRSLAERRRRSPSRGLGRSRGQRRRRRRSTAVWALAADPRRAQAHKSPALEADGHHVMTDVVTSVGVIAGLDRRRADRLAFPRSAAGAARRA
jgi:divalent metal cation (Fe/Co/Zn/Cd) transporter